MIEMVDPIFSRRATAVHVATTPFLAYFGPIAALVIGHALDSINFVKGGSSQLRPKATVGRGDEAK